MDRTIDNPSINASQPETVSVRSRERMSKEIWPNFFIVGAPRSGTTSLYEYLKAVPGIYMSPVKEPNYFAPDLYTRYRGKPILAFGKYFCNRAKYLELFEKVKDEVAVGEASVSYLSDPEAPGRIKEVVPEARIIVILRDPVERVYLQYLMHVRQGWQRASFEEAARTNLYLEPSLYANQVQRYLDVFGSDHVKILIFEEFIQNPRKAVSEVLKFLGVNAEPPVIVGKAYNFFTTPHYWPLIGRIMRWRPARVAMRLLFSPRIRWIIRQHVIYRKASEPPMPEKARRFLEELFRSDVLRLEQILGRPLPWFHAKDQLAQDQDKRSAGGDSNARR